MLNTNNYNTRYFNTIIENKTTLIKSSSHINKIKYEYCYYYYLPNKLKHYFVTPYNFCINNNIASYEMKKIVTENVGKLFYNKKINKNSFIKLLQNIDNFKQQCVNEGGTRICAPEESYCLVIEKTKDRINGNYSNLFERILSAYNSYIWERTTWNKIISHGDLCLSNMLWIEPSNEFKLIDPRGAKIVDDIYMDEYYDWAKLSHSFLGGYENILYNETVIDEIIPYVKTHFLNLIDKYQISLNLLRVYEASLFLSMVPLHKDKPNNVKLFLQVCDKILEEVGF